jgi:hypothetical protein
MVSVSFASRQGGLTYVKGQRMRLDDDMDNNRM